MAGFSLEPLAIRACLSQARWSKAFQRLSGKQTPIFRWFLAPCPIFFSFFWKRCCQRHQKTWIFVVLGSPFSSATLTKVVYVHHLNMYCSLYLLCFYQRYVNKIWILISADTQLWSCTCMLSTILNCSHNLPVGSSSSADFWVVTWVRSSDCCFNNTKVLTRDPVQLYFQCFKIDANIYMGFNIWVSSVHCDWRLST